MRLPDLIDQIGRTLLPTTIVYGTGLHDRHGGGEHATLDAFRYMRERLQIASPCPIWKTTTRVRGENAAKLTAHAASIFASGPVLDAARYTDSLLLTRHEKDLYADLVHFLPSSGVYHDLNIALLAGLYSHELRAKPDVWEQRFGAAGPYLLSALTRRCGS